MQTFEPSRDGAAQPVSEAIRRLAADADAPRGVGLFAELLYASGDQGVLGGRVGHGAVKKDATITAPQCPDGRLGLSFT